MAIVLTSQQTAGKVVSCMSNIKDSIFNCRSFFFLVKVALSE